MTTLQEIETHWSYPDLLKANDALDIEDEIEEKLAELIRNEAKH